MDVFSKAASIVALGAVTLFSVNLSHAATYQVSDTSRINCTNAPHGLWTNGDIGGGSCSNYFSIDGLLEINTDDANSANWYAELTATATNPQNVVADIDLRFDDWAYGHSYKQEGGAPYDITKVDFFTSILGTITINSLIYDIDGFAGGYAFQYGIGANAKDPLALGASAWIKSCTDGAATNLVCMNSSHWDLNLEISPVPVPAAIWLFGTALVGFVGISRRRKIA